MMLSDLQCPVFAHIVCWFGSGNKGHIDMGYSSGNLGTVVDQMTSMKSKGITGVNPLWSGIGVDSDKQFATRAVTEWMRVCETHNFPFFLTIDHPEAFSLDSLSMLSVFFSSPQYYRWGGKPVLLVFDKKLSAEQLAAIPDCVLVYRNADGLTAAKSGGAFEWPSPPQTKAYTDYFHSKTSGITDKLIVNHVCPGFRGASWNSPDMVIPWRAGQEWQDSISRLPAKPMMVLIATWNDHDEGSGIEGTYLL